MNGRISWLSIQWDLSNESTGITWACPELSPVGTRRSILPFFFFFLVSLSQIILQRACPFRCNIWWEETFLPMNTVPLGIIISFFCLLSCNLAHSKNGPHFFQLSLRHFYCGIGHIYFSKFSIGLNAGTGTQIPLSLIIRGMQFMLFITYGRTVCEVIDLSNC